MPGFAGHFHIELSEGNGAKVMAKKLKSIPIVPFELLIEGHEGIIADREKNGPGEPTIALVKALADNHTPEEILAVSYRLGALAKLIEGGNGREWTITVLHQSYKLVNEALFRAAARSPLNEAATVGQVAFNANEFIKIAMEESEPDGSA